MDAERCVVCGEMVPEGRMICRMHEIEYADDSPLYQLWLCVVPRGEMFNGHLQPFLAGSQQEAERLGRQVLGWRHMPQMVDFEGHESMRMLRWLHQNIPAFRLRPLINGAWFENRQEVRHG